MALVLPLTNDGCRRVSVNTPAGLLVFRTYYLPILKSWLCDIFDSAGNALISGINLVVRVDNLLKGRGDTLDGHTLRMYSISDGENNSADSLGYDCFAVLFGPDDDIPAIYESVEQNELPPLFEDE